MEEDEQFQARKQIKLNFNRIRNIFHHSADKKSKTEG